VIPLSSGWAISWCARACPEELYHAAYTFLATGAAASPCPRSSPCAGFGAICGSSDRHRRDCRQGGLPVDGKFRLTGNSLGRCGFHRRGRHARHPDPASVIMVIYGIMTETNIGKLLAAEFFRASWRRCFCA